MTKYLVAFIVLITASLAIAEDQTLPTGEIGKTLAARELKNYQRLSELTDYSLAASGFEDFPMTSDIFDIDYKSPGKGFMYSLMIPGGGQLYTGSKTKAFIFMGIEALAWGGYLVYHDQGKQQEKDNNSFADTHWDAERYNNWLIEELGITSDDQEYIQNDSVKTFTHHLPDTKTQQYYEMIGKYDQFRYGWDDTDYMRGKDSSDYRNAYLLDRSTANDKFDKAKLGAIVAIANHLFSAFDAALSARRYNRQQDSFSEISLKARMAKHEGKQIPKLILTYKF
ncbi:MAG: hypothetical protein WBP29_01365 [Candidatus Zixiibacteriota bacterium]